MKGAEQVKEVWELAENLGAVPEHMNHRFVLRPAVETSGVVSLAVLGSTRGHVLQPAPEGDWADSSDFIGYGTCPRQIDCS